MAVVAARATRLPIYSSFAKEGNLSDLFAKGEAISTLFNVVGMGAGLQLASTICSSIQGKVGSLEFPLSDDLFPLFACAFFNDIKRFKNKLVLNLSCKDLATFLHFWSHLT